MVGLGGGFILVPILLFVYPDAPPSIISSISLTVVFLNASSATLSNLRARRIDMKTAGLMAIGTVPTAILGAIVAGRVSRDHFELFMGIMLILGAIYVLWRSAKAAAFMGRTDHQPNREIHERRGPMHQFYVNTLMAGFISPIGAFISSFFGIGGGVVNVPALTFILKIPSRLVAPTNLMILTFSSSSGLITRIISGDYSEGWRRAGLLGLGALIGAQIGIYFSTRVNQRVFLIILAFSMALVGVRQIIAGI
ncbi:MAG: sulfite exporter TauE/SafE family protein [Chloroflexi bacterium]|nr:sulfite exporter TauE/SafE family protein [Chloroflexota bacterium]